MADTSSDARRNELILAPNEFAYISDETKGNVDIYSGPHKTSLAASDQPVIFSATTKKFERVDLRSAIQTIVVAPEGWYITLKNPARDKARQHPKAGVRESMPELDVGRKIVVPGPASFPLWPAQMAKVLPGHTLRSNQYLLVKVYDEAAARENWKNSIVKAAKKGPDGEAPNADTEKLLGQMPDLTMGKLIVIRGTDVSFYIPPTGVEVVTDEAGKLIREAVTLERLEYCLLLDENGKKRYVQGPDVVFPKPTEIWVTRQVSRKDETPRSTRKFKAIELSETAGLYIKVIADYIDEKGTDHKVGDELFVTGKEGQMIYFPREEHAIIKYNDQEVHYATAIPAGEGRYVLNRLDGKVRMVEGPAMFLPDPRKEVILRRVLDLKTCSLLYPGNQEALAYNAALLGVDLATYNLEQKNKSGIMTPSAAARGGVGAAYAAAVEGGPLLGSAMYLSADASVVSNSAEGRGLGGVAREGFTGDRFQRKDTYTEPRTLTLNTKYAGAVTSSIWTGYAIMLVSKSGERRVVQGPAPVMLQYDEDPQKLTLSTGKPKTTDSMYETYFLRTHANMVSDIVEVETKDFCKINVKLSYRVNFEGDPMKWFAVENYVKFLCDHMRSRLRTAVRKHGVEEFTTNSEVIVRDIVLGKAVDPGTGKVNTRPGAVFEENGMHVYDVEVLNVGMQNSEIEKLLIGAQREVMNHTLTLQSARRTLDFTTESEQIKQKTLEVQAQTKKKDIELKEQELEQKLQLDLATLNAAKQTEVERTAAAKSKEDAETLLHGIRLARQKAEQEQHQDQAEKHLAMRLQELEAEVDGVVKRGEAIKPDLIAALTAFGERATLQAVAEAMAPLAILGGAKKPVTEILGDMLKGTPFAKHLLPAANGTAKPEVAPRA